MFFSSIEKNDGDIISEIIAEPEVLKVELQTSHEVIQQISPAVEMTEEKTPLTTHDLPLTTKVKRELPKTSTMGSMFKEIHKEVVTAKDENKLELSTENVVEIWQDFLTDNKNKLQNAFLSAAQEQVPQLIDDKITFTASNNISLEMLQLHKMDITTYFRKRTTSITVVPDFILQRNESAQKTYKTPKDRLKEMITENSAVLKLIEKFDLKEY